MSQIIIYIMAFFAVIGAVDRCMGNKYGYGKKFEEGINSAGPLVLAMVGILSLTPIISKLLYPIVNFLHKLTGADPSLFINSFLAVDMGGYALALELAKTNDAALFSGLIVGSMLGTTIIFTIPIAFGIIEEEDKSIFAKGILSGVSTIPIGAIAGGLVAGFPLKLIVMNTIPIIIFSSLICLGLKYWPEKLSKSFIKLGKFMTIVITLGLAITIVETLTGKVPFENLNPIDSSMKTITRIAITLSGALPLVHFITKHYEKPLLKLARIMHTNESAIAGLLASLANCIPMFKILNQMDRNGKIINTAFSVSGAFVLGGQLAFIANANGDMIVPFIVSKLVAGGSAIFVAKKLFINLKGEIYEKTF